MHFASKMANWLQYSCGLFWFSTIGTYYAMYALLCFSPQNYRDEVAAKVCNETCFVFRSEQGHEVPPDKKLVPDLLPLNSTSTNTAYSNFPSVVPSLRY